MRESVNSLTAVPGVEDAGVARRAVPPAYVRSLTITAVVVLLGVQVFLWVVNLDDIVELDLRTFYTAGYMVRTGHAGELYDPQAQLYFQNLLVSKGRLALPYIHPPYEALLDAPFSLLSYRSAYFVFIAFNLLLLGASFWLLRPRMNNLAAIFPWLPIVLFLSFIPIADALIQDQDSILLLLIFIVTGLLLDRHRFLEAGAVLALGLFRFQIVLPIALLFLLWRRWRFCIGFTFSSAVLFFVSLFMVGWSGVKVYCATLLSFTHRASPQDDHLIRVLPQYMLNLRGMIFTLNRVHVPDSWLPVLTALASIAVLFWAARKPAIGSLTVAIPAAALVSYHFLVHDMSVLLLPIVLVMDQFVHFEGTRDSRRWLFRSAAFLFVVPIMQVFLWAGNYLVFLALPILAFFLLVVRASRSSTIADKGATAHPAVAL